MTHFIGMDCHVILNKVGRGKKNIYSSKTFQIVFGRMLRSYQATFVRIIQKITNNKMDMIVVHRC